MRGSKEKVRIIIKCIVNVSIETMITQGNARIQKANTFENIFTGTFFFLTTENYLM